MTKSILFAATMLAFTGGIASAQETPAPTIIQAIPAVSTLVIFTVLASGGNDSSTNSTTSE